MAALKTARVRRREPGMRGLDDAGLPPLLERVYRQRGIASADELDLSLQRLLPWRDLGGIEVAARRIIAAMQAHERILVVGDFDCDGATGTALAVSGLRAFGAAQVDFAVPDRFRQGYGLTPELVACILPRQPDLIVTVDNGIASLDGVAAARAAGVDVVVTDHHLPGAELPAAAAIVNPNQPGDAFASKALAGVGVVFYVLIAIRSLLRDAGQAALPNLAQWLDLVALGTVADLVPLDFNNRILVEQGLRRMRAGRARPGIQALIDVSGRQTAKLQASDLGFAVGPRLNAAGRLEHMAAGIDCLLAPDLATAAPLAGELDALNAQRRQIQADMQSQAETLVTNVEGAEQAHGLVVSETEWHEGVVGLVASRLKERYHRPVVALAPLEAGGFKGSARSIRGFHIRDALALVDARQPGLIERFGGHAMAAGLTLAPGALEAFTRAFEAVCAEGLTAEQLEAVLDSDGSAVGEGLGVDQALALRGGGPFGQQFEAPLFDDEFEVTDQRIVGGAHLKLKLRPCGARSSIDAIAFGCDEPLSGGALRLAYRLDVNEYFGDPRLQLIVEAQVVD